MADIQSIFLPRRGKKSTMNGTKKTQVLAKGELFIEAPDTGVGTGHARAKVGDGATQYGSLPYAWGETENDKIAFTSNTSTTVAAALNSVVSGNTLATLIAGLKQAIVKSDARVTELNDDIGDHNHDDVYSKIGHTHSGHVSNVYVNNDGKLVVSKDGADTVLNFSGGDIVVTDKWTTCINSNQNTEYEFTQNYESVRVSRNLDSGNAGDITPSIPHTAFNISLSSGSYYELLRHNGRGHGWGYALTVLILLNVKIGDKVKAKVYI